MALKNLWQLHNLKESPYFQQDLQGTGRYPIDLFVGRDEEAQRLLHVIGGAASSRQTVEGLPGFGKTTLTQFVKARAAAAGYLSYPDPVSAAGADTPDTLLARLLSYVYDAFASQVGHRLLKEPVVDEARRLVLDTRVRGVKVAASVAGFGFDRDVTERTERASFRSALLTIPPLLRDLSAAAREHGFTGIIVHLNDLENLVTEPDRARAGMVMRDLRDIFLLEGYHFMLVGTPEAVRSIVAPHAQLRSIFGVSRPLEPLSEDAFERLLTRRYEHLRLGKAEAQPPVVNDAARELYRIFRGDLRGTLRALDTGAHELIGLTDPPGSPVRTPELMAVLAPMLAAEAAATLSDTLLEYLYALRQLDRPFTQKDLIGLWHLSQAAVSQNLRELQRLGYVQEQRREGRQVTYALTGPSRIFLGVTV